MLFVLILVCILVPLLSEAADKVCGNTTQLCRYLESVERSLVHTYSCEVWPRTDPVTVVSGTCTVIPSGQGATHRAFMAAHPDKRKLAVVGGLPAEKDASTIAAIDAQDAAALATRQALETERTTNDICTETDLSVINTRIDQVVDPIANLTDAKAALKTLMRKVARCLIARTQ